MSSLNIRILIDDFDTPISLTSQNIEWKHDFPKTENVPVFTDKTLYRHNEIQLSDLWNISEFKSKTKIPDYKVNILETTHDNILTTLSFLFPDFYDPNNPYNITSSYYDFLNDFTLQKLWKKPEQKDGNDSLQLLQENGRYFLPISICWLNDIRCHPYYKQFFQTIMDVTQWYKDKAKEDILMVIQKNMYTMRDDNLYKDIETILNSMVLVLTEGKPTDSRRNQYNYSEIQRKAYESIKENLESIQKDIPNIDPNWKGIKDRMVELSPKTSPSISIKYIDDLNTINISGYENMDTMDTKMIELALYMFTNHSDFCSLQDIQNLLMTSRNEEYIALSKDVSILLNTYESLYKAERVALLNADSDIETKQEITSIINKELLGQSFSLSEKAKEHSAGLLKVLATQYSDKFQRMESKFQTIKDLVKSISIFNQQQDQQQYSGYRYYNQSDPLESSMKDLLGRSTVTKLFLFGKIEKMIQSNQFVFAKSDKSDESLKSNESLMEELRKFPIYEMFLKAQETFSTKVKKSSNPLLDKLIDDFISNRNNKLIYMIQYIFRNHYKMPMNLTDTEKREINALENRLQKNNEERQLFYVGFTQQTQTQEEDKQKLLDLYLSMSVVEIPWELKNDKKRLKSFACSLKKSFLGHDFQYLLTELFPRKNPDKVVVSPLYESKRFKLNIDTELTTQSTDTTKPPNTEEQPIQLAKGGKRKTKKSKKSKRKIQTRKPLRKIQTRKRDRKSKTVTKSKNANKIDWNKCINKTS